MTLVIVMSVIAGILCGKFIVVQEISYISTLLDVGLCLLMFFVGIDIGKNKDVMSQIKSIGVKAISTPLMVASGSLVGAVVCGKFLGYGAKDSSLIGAGMAWYSLSAIMITPYSKELSVLAFLTNVCREVFAIVLIPLIAKYIGHEEAIAPSGATAMDTTLPIISKATDARTAIISFITGFILTLSVPILVTLLLSLG